MLSICTSPPTMLRFWLIMGGELEQIFGNIHPTFANLKLEKVFEYHLLKTSRYGAAIAFNRYKTRCVIIVSQGSIYGADLHPAHAFLPHWLAISARELPNIPLKQSTNVFPAFPQ